MLKIETILSLLKEDQNFRQIIWQDHYYYNWSDVTFSAISYDSRKVSADTLFFAKGASFHKNYLDKAIQDGLGFYISEVDYGVSIPLILVTDIKQAMSLLAMAFYDNPQDKLKLLAFTGTKGKTTAAYFAYHILKQSHKPALLSTANTTLDGQTFFKSQLTTPESLDLFAMMAEAVQNGMTHFIMEVSSQAYLVKRVYGLTFDVGVFLNISPDHIGPIEHPTFEDYFYHKRLLLENSRAAIVNAGMDHFDLIKEILADRDFESYGPDSPNAITHSQAFHFTSTGVLAGDYDCQLIGKFNQENALAAGLACSLLGATPADIKTGIAQTTVPGRMEVLSQKNGAKVFVDYAHNGDSLDKLIQVVQEHQKGKITLIIGAPGNKAESRRKDFGLLLNRYPDVQVILSADDPNFEDPQDICQKIASHMTRPYDIIVDRTEAIKTALTRSQGPEDAVIIAGKGADAYQIVEGQKDSRYLGDLVVTQALLSEI